MGWSATSAPIAFLLLAGIALGPQGINLLSSSLVASLDPVIPVALATFGVLIGLAVGDRRTSAGRVIGAACLDNAVTTFAVAAGMAVVMTTGALGAEFSWPLLVALAICASTSLTLPAGTHLEPRSTATRISELGVVFPIISGGFLLAWSGTHNAWAAAVLLAQASGLTLILAIATWLLLTRTSSEMEQRVISVAALLLVGGAAGALALSALFGGWVAGVSWRSVGPTPRELITRGILFVQHPILVLVLLMAGARAEISTATIIVGTIYVVVRAVAKLAAATFVNRLAADDARELEGRLLSPGVYGVAFALNVLSVGGPEASWLLASVVVGTIGSELVALLIARSREG
jgi:hypothetical protein